MRRLTRLEAQSPMFPYAQFQSVISRLRFKDETALRGLGLAKLGKAYDAYPIAEGARKLFVLLPRGMDPQSAQKLGEAHATRQIIVLEHGAKGVAKVWPTTEAEKAAAQQPAPKAASGDPAPAPDTGLDIEFVEE